MAREVARLQVQAGREDQRPAGAPLDFDQRRVPVIETRQDARRPAAAGRGSRAGDAHARGPREPHPAERRGQAVERPEQRMPGSHHRQPARGAFRRVRRRVLDRQLDGRAEQVADQPRVDAVASRQQQPAAGLDERGDARAAGAAQPVRADDHGHLARPPAGRARRAQRGRRKRAERERPRLGGCAEGLRQIERLRVERPAVGDDVDHRRPGRSEQGVAGVVPPVTVPVRHADRRRRRAVERPFPAQRVGPGDQRHRPPGRFAPVERQRRLGRGRLRSRVQDHGRDPVRIGFDGGHGQVALDRRHLGDLDVHVLGNRRPRALRPAGRLQIGHHDDPPGPPVQQIERRREPGGVARPPGRRDQAFDGVPRWLAAGSRARRDLRGVVEGHDREPLVRRRRVRRFQGALAGPRHLPRRRQARRPVDGDDRDAPRAAGVGQERPREGQGQQQQRRHPQGQQQQLAQPPAVASAHERAFEEPHVAERQPRRPVPREEMQEDRRGGGQRREQEPGEEERHQRRLRAARYSRSAPSSGWSVPTRR